MTAAGADRVGRLVRALGLSALAAAGAALGSCGARSDLPLGRERFVPASVEFCAQETYQSGYQDLSLYLLLDRSESMLADGKWAQATAAIQAFVDDPELAGTAVALQMFPVDTSCDQGKYALPHVPMALLPGNAAAVKQALAGQVPDGGTPMTLALRGAVEYARGLALGDPSRFVAVAIVTDGNPNACGSSPDTVSNVANQGVQGAPQVLTFVIGLKTGYLDTLSHIAQAGGTGQLIVIGEQGAAQGLVDALRSLRDQLQSCRFAVPPAPGQSVTAADVAVSYRLADGEPTVSLARLGSPASCASGHGFYLDAAVGHLQLCPATCDLLHGSSGSSVTVTAGCGAGLDAGTAPADGGDQCGGVAQLTCKESCDAPGSVAPYCAGTFWKCPPGTISTQQCAECPAVPHGCCNPDGTLAQASCIDGAWVCPPGAAMFGTEGCKPPGVCAALMPCPTGSYCEVADHTCGTKATAGTCKPSPASCSGGPPACGCDGLTHEHACAAHQKGGDISVTKACPTPPGRFDCGPLFCSIGAEVCRKTTSLTAPNRYDCVPKPGACPSGCGCDLCPPCPGSACTESCTNDDGGAILLCTQL